MLFKTLPLSTHEKVVIRPIEAGDIAPWYDYLCLPEVFTHTSWNLQSEDELKHYVRNSDRQTATSKLRFAIADRQSNNIVGTIGFHTVQPENLSAELTYDLAPTSWGYGIASTVAADLVEWGHRDADLIRIQATVLHSNLRSIRLLERIGFKKEGLLHSFRMVRGTPGDFWMYSHLQ